MKSVSVNWFGPYPLSGTTPREISRRMGVYAVVCGSAYVFIGKAKRGKGIFREAKGNREPEYWEGLRKLKIVSSEKPAWYRLRDTVYSRCEVYAGVLSRDDIVKADDVEKFLIYLMKPVRNEKYEEKLEIKEDLELFNSGSLPPKLKPKISSSG